MRKSVINITVLLSSVSMLALTSFAQDQQSVWNQLSVWEQSKAQQNKVEGVVKTFAHDESNNQYMIKVKTPEGFKTLKICNDGIQSANNQSDFNGGNSNKDALQKAMDNGAKVSLTYGGTWDSCIKGIKVEQDENDQDTAEESGGGDKGSDAEPSAAEAISLDEQPTEDGFADL
jgi:hypothetical protein